MEEKLLIAAYWDSTIRIYNEEDSEDSELLKVLSGGNFQYNFNDFFIGHDKSEILCLCYSPKLNLLASASRNGMIAIWDIEVGKLETVFQADQHEITALEFSEQYPVLVSCNDNGVLNLWGVSKKI